MGVTKDDIKFLKRLKILGVETIYTLKKILMERAWNPLITKDRIVYSKYNQIDLLRGR